jgi:hypothetical protein
MSWLRRLFGSGDGATRGSSATPEPRRAHGRAAGPVYGQADVPLERAKAQLLELLRERGARSAVIEYDGGQDEGFMTSFEFSRAPLAAEPTEWSGSLPDPTAVDIDAALEASGTPDQTLYEAAEAVMCDKWGTFAGSFEVEGRLVVDVDSGRIARIDVVKVWEDYEGDDEPSAEREVEVF